LRLAVMLVAGVPSCFAQDVRLSLSSGTGRQGDTVMLSISLSSRTVNAPAALVWTLNYSGVDISSASVTAEAIATAAGKALSCNYGVARVTCALWGFNDAPVANGVIASAAFTLSNSSASSWTPIQLTSDVAADFTGAPLSVSTTGGGVSIQMVFDTSAVTGLRFIPITPCRIADTRAGQALSGPFGPPSLSASSTRNFPVQASACGIPSTARAYSFNVTAVPSGPLGFLTIFPAGQPRPLVSTLNSLSGDIWASAAIVPSGSNGAVSIFVTNDTNVVLDVNGYFAPPDYIPTGGASSLVFFPVVPCRVADTRSGSGKTGPFGAPNILGQTSRDFPIASSSCGIPASAKAYSLNFTVLPLGTLSFLSTWPSGLGRPTVSTLNSIKGKILANAALVPAGINGSVAIFVTDNADLLIDVNGYFAEPSFLPPNGTPGLLFYPIVPCRAVDTRAGQNTAGQFGPPRLSGGAVRFVPIPSSPCGITSIAQAFSTNITVIPPGPLSYLTVWPTGQPQPFVSTLNSLDGSTLANAAIVSAGLGGGINLLTPEPTDVIVDVNGFFAP
jgi:hypothetical protein